MRKSADASAQILKKYLLGEVETVIDEEKKVVREGRLLLAVYWVALFRAARARLPGVLISITCLSCQKHSDLAEQTDVAITDPAKIKLSVCCNMLPGTPV